MRGLAVCLFIFLAGAATAGTQSDPEPSGCAERLERSLVEMRSRPLLKEEHATALMWLRMDAAEAEAAGDEAACVSNIIVVERLLGMGTD